MFSIIFTLFTYIFLFIQYNNSVLSFVYKSKSSKNKHKYEALRMGLTKYEIKSENIRFTSSVAIQLDYIAEQYKEPIIDYNNSQIHEIIHISPLIINSSDIVTIYFNSNNPNSSDWIGAYSPANVDITKSTPVKWQYCDEFSPSYLQNNSISYGQGSLTFNFTNLRSDIIFVYFTNNIDNPIAVNISNVNVSFVNNNQPLRPRVTLTGDYDIFNFAWSSAYSTTPILKWGTIKGIYNNIVPAINSAIKNNDLCGQPANSTGWRDLGLIHTSQFVGMKALANSNIYYIFGDELTNDFSKEFKLHIPPLPGTQPPSRPTTVILFGDLGRGSTDEAATWNNIGCCESSVFTSQSLAPRVQAEEIDMIFHNGDISYASGYISVWDFYMDMNSPVASGVPYLTTVGNHETDWYENSYIVDNDSGGEVIYSLFIYYILYYLILLTLLFYFVSVVLSLLHY